MSPNRNVCSNHILPNDDTRAYHNFCHWKAKMLSVQSYVKPVFTVNRKRKERISIDATTCRFSTSGRSNVLEFLIDCKTRNKSGNACEKKLPSYEVVSDNYGSKIALIRLSNFEIKTRKFRKFQPKFTLFRCHFLPIQGKLPSHSRLRTHLEAEKEFRILLEAHDNLLLLRSIPESITTAYEDTNQIGHLFAIR